MNLVIYIKHQARDNTMSCVFLLYDVKIDCMGQLFY